MRREAAGHGAVFFVREMLKILGDALEGRTCMVSGPGNVAGAHIPGFVKVAQPMVSLGPI